MPGTKQKKSRKRAKKKSSADVDQLRPGMPAKDSIREVVDFVSPQKVRYQILKTTETDVYDPPARPEKQKRGSKS
jgi:hypothetical protein